MKQAAFKQVVRRIVREELKNYKSEIIKEIKADLFDVLLTSKPSSKTAGITEVNAFPDGTVLDKRTHNYVKGTIADTLKSTLPPHGENKSNGQVTIISDTRDIPQTFDGRKLTEDHQNVINNVINKDYSALMKKMGI